MSKAPRFGKKPLILFKIGSVNLVRQGTISLIAILLNNTLYFYGSQTGGIGGEVAISVYGLATRMAMFALFPLIDTGNFYLVIVGVTGGLVFLGMMYGPQAAFFAELFSTEVRYSGASLGYQLGAIIGGSFAPIIATLLWKNYDIFWVSVYIAFASILSLISVYMLTETFQKDLND